MSVDGLFKLGNRPRAEETLSRASAMPSPSEPARVLSIDPALRNTGYAILEMQGRDPKLITYGVIRNVPKLLPSGCLVAIRQQLSDVIQQHAPNVCAIESTIYVQSFKTAIALGTARGAALIAAAEFGLPSLRVFAEGDRAGGGGERLGPERTGRLHDPLHAASARDTAARRGRCDCGWPGAFPSVGSGKDHAGRAEAHLSPIEDRRDPSLSRW